MSAEQGTHHYDVQLAIYDLSRGMARAMSAQFLGPQFAIDVVPHTGLVVYGNEYYFGGGIQSENPAHFRRSTGMVPMQVQFLGRTTVTQAQFETWCRQMQQSGQYDARAYDLLSRNCNNFCHDAALQGLQLATGVPTWILEVPSRFLASPMGQMMRPMLENMQLGAGTPQPNSVSAPFHGSSNNNNASASLPARVAVANTTNPWANNSTTPTATNGGNSSAGLPATNTTTKSDAKVATSVAATTLLDSFSKPLLSNDTNTVGLCVKKLFTACANDDEKEALGTCKQSLTSTSQKNLSRSVVQTTCTVILRVLELESTAETSTKITTFALMLLRIVVLKAPTGSASDIGEEENGAALRGCLKWLQCALSVDATTTNDSNTEPLKSSTARSVAWLAASNTVGSLYCDYDGSGRNSKYDIALSLQSSIPRLLETFVEAAAADVSLEFSPAEVRQAASALLYNVAILKSNHCQHDSDEDGDGLEDDLLVSILAASLEGIVEETDTTTKLRRLMAAGRIIKPCGSGKTLSSRTTSAAPAETVINKAAVRLVVDLGFAEALEQVVAVPADKRYYRSTVDARKCQRLAKELLLVLTS